ncbi:MAG TPA: aminodeoxychorismate/anthranilate synthase component II [Myxococcota bacterium]|nr:aminodeoxychorismate/anthranilate synthase component II [Myxococcota bacterium]
MIWMIDNYDSFTWNLVQYLWILGAEVKVVRNDEVSVEDVLAARPRAVVVSPGPGAPAEAGVSVAVVRALPAAGVAVLGVCLGHQSIGEAFGGRVVRARRLMHGKTSPVHHDGRGLFAGLPNPFEATRYHSLVVERASLPPELEVSATTEDADEVMGLRHRALPLEGVQFHPESILTLAGMDLLRNWVRAAGAR